MDIRKLFAEFLGTALLVIFAVGVATETFGYLLGGQAFGRAGISGGIVATALAFGLTVLALAYTIGPISGCHVNPAVTMGFLVSGRMAINEALGYWAAQFLGGIAGAAVLWGVFSTGNYSRLGVGLGANGYGSHSLLGINAGGAVIAEVILTFLFVLVVLGATSRLGSPGFGGLAIGLALVVVHLVGIPLTGTSVNPARSLGPALIVQHDAIKQVWVFIVAPLAGGALAALVYNFLFAGESTTAEADAAIEEDRAVGPTSATP
jgi:aquaporin Z